MRSLFLCVVGLCTSVLAGCPQPLPPDASDAIADQGPRVDVRDVPDVRDGGMDVRDVATDIPDARDVPVTDVPPDAGCEFDNTYSYGFEGGMPPYDDVSALSPARSFTRRRTFTEAGRPPLECSNSVPMCGAAGVIHLGDIMDSIRDPDVQNALSQPIEIVFGYDSRLAKGQVFGFHRADGRGFFVGEACAGRPGCIDVPDALALLVGQLFALDNQQLEDPMCSLLR